MDKMGRVIAADNGARSVRRSREKVVTLHRVGAERTLGLTEEEEGKQRCFMVLSW